MADYDKKFAPLDFNKDGKITPAEEAAASRAGGNLRTLAEQYTPSANSSLGNSSNNTSQTSGNKNKDKDKTKDKPQEGITGISIDNGQFTATYADGTGAAAPISGAFISWNTGEQPVAWTLSKAIKQIQKRYGVDTVWKAVEKVYPSIVGTGYGGTSYIGALTELVKNYSVANYYAVAGGDGTSGAMTFFDFLNGMQSSGGSGGPSGPSYQVSLTGKNTAWEFYKSTYRNLLGSNPTKAEFDDYYSKLNAEEKKYISSSNTAGSTTTNVSENFDITTFTTRYILKNADLTGDLKGVAGQYQNFISQSAKDYGLDGLMSDKKSSNYLKGLISGKFQEDDLTDMLRRQAALTYGAFADDLEKNPDLSLAEIMDAYTSVYSNVLEIGANEVNLKDVAKYATAMGGGKANMYDFEKSLRQDGRYQYTKGANAEAQNLAVQFARAFGMNI